MGEETGNLRTPGMVAKVRLEREGPAHCGYGKGNTSLAARVAEAGNKKTLAAGYVS